MTCILFIPCTGGYRGTKRVRSKTSSERNEGPSQKSAKNNPKDDED